MSNCATCIEADCGLTDDLDLFSLQSPLFPFLLTCPPGSNCGNAYNIRLVCGTEIIFVTIPVSATAAQRQSLIAEALGQCARKKIFDDPGEEDGGDGFEIDPDGAPVNIFSSREVSCDAYCSTVVTIVDGAPVVTKSEAFTYTLAAGAFIGFTQAQANAFAAQSACTIAKQRLFCLSALPLAFCHAEEFNQTIRARGAYISRFPFTDSWTISGTLPPGLTFHGGNITGGSAVIDGTPTTGGLYTFTITVTLGTPGAQGDHMSKTYTLAIVEIDTDSNLEPLEIGTPYLQNMSVIPAHDQETEVWSKVSGAFPDGVELTSNGILHGTPTEDGAFPFTAQVVATINGVSVTCEKAFEFSACPIPPDYSYNCPLNAVPKSYTPANDYFVAFNDDLNRAMISGAAGEVDIVNFTPGVPVLDFTIALDTTGRVLGGIYDPVNEVMVFCRWEDILVSQPTISFVNNSGTVLSEITLSGFGAGLKNNPYFTLLTAGTKYVVLFLNSFSVGDKSSLLLINTATRTVIAQRDFTGASATEYDDGEPAFSCVENEIVLTYRSGNSFLHKMNAVDLTTVSVVDMGIDYTLFPAYDPATNQIIAVRNTGPIRYVVYLNPVTGALEHSIDTAYLGNLTPGIYNFKLLAFILGKYDNGTVHYYDSLTHTEKCSVSFAGMTNPYTFAVRRSNGSVYVLDQGASEVWELNTT